MSGIYIKGMEMPKSCFECKLLDYTDTFKCRYRFESLTREHGINISRPNWCPLIPVPDHGDLIDRDKLEKDIDNYIGGEESRSRFHHWVQVQDAVIPMDKGEEK